ncbi:MAG: metallophosphoesterase [Bacilli bacterium]|nr:metallophosphoesterase [Bacilli bacterium]
MKIYVNERFLNSQKVDRKFKIVNLTDIHFRGDKFSKDIKDVIGMLERIKPDMISLTGDFIDSLEYGVNYQRELQEYFYYLADISPTFMSFGSHDLELFLANKSREEMKIEREKYQKEYFAFLKSISKNFYPIIPGSSERIDLGENISVMGYSYLDDEGPDMECIHADITHMKKQFDAMNIDNDRFNILLCHSPLVFFDRGKMIDDCGNFDLILSGHNHAAMIPHCLEFLPFGILGPDKSILPRHSVGLYQNAQGTNIDISPGFLKVPGIVMEDLKALGAWLYWFNNLYSREMDVININDDVKKIKKMD